MSKPRFILALGIFFILFGLLVPSSTLISILRGSPPIELQEQLFLGAKIFKLNLMLLGVFIGVLSRLSIWKKKTRKNNFSFDSSHKSITFFLVVILVISLGLRLYKLNLGPWIDEVVTYVNYAKMPFGEIITTYDSQNTHLLYSLLSHASFQLFGESIWSLRLPAVLFGICSIWALFILGREVGNNQEALLAAALLAFSYHHIWFSQNARGYTGLLFWTILSSWIFLKALNDDKPRLWLFYALSASLGIFTHLTMIFIVLAHFIIYLSELIFRRKKIWPLRWSGFFIGFFFTCFLTLQLYALVLPQIFSGTIEEGIKSAVTEWKNPLWSAYELLKGIRNIFSVNVLTLLGAIIVIGLGLWGFARKNPIIIWLLFIPAIITLAVFTAMRHPLWPRTFFFIIGFGVLIIIRGVIVLGRWSTRLLPIKFNRSNSFGVVLCVGLIFISALSLPRVYAPKQDYLGALRFIEERRLPEDIVVTVGVPATFVYKRFHKVDWKEVNTIADLEEIRSSAKRTWIIYTIPLHVKAEYPDIYDSILHDFKVIKEFNGTLSGGTIFVCRSDKS